MRRYRWANVGRFVRAELVDRLVRRLSGWALRLERRNPRSSVADLLGEAAAELDDRWGTR